MKRTKKLLPVILVMLIVAAAVFFAWRYYGTNQKETLYKAINQAWQQANDENTPEYLEYIDKHSKFRITSIEQGEPLVLSVTVRGVDLAGELRKIDPLTFSWDMDEEDLNDYLISLVKQAGSTEVTTILYAWPEENGAYRIQFSETFIDAMSGMVYSYAQEWIDELVGGM